MNLYFNIFVSLGFLNPFTEMLQGVAASSAKETIVTKTPKRFVLRCSFRQGKMTTSMKEISGHVTQASYLLSCDKFYLFSLFITTLGHFPEILSIIALPIKNQLVLYSDGAKRP